MNQSSRLRIFPWVTLFAGAVGFAMRSWLLSNEDSKGLIPQNNLAESLCFILLALVLAVCLLAMKKLDDTRGQVPGTPIAVGNMVGAAVMVLSALLHTKKDLLPALVCACSVIIGMALLYDALIRIKGKPASPVAHYLCMALMIPRILLSSRSWSGETQAQRFIFELFAMLFFLLALYYRAQLTIAGTGRKRYLLFTQAALYCFCLCLANTDALFALGAGVWLAAESCHLPAARGECV